MVVPPPAAVPAPFALVALVGAGRLLLRRSAVGADGVRTDVGQGHTLHVISSVQHVERPVGVPHGDPGVQPTGQTTVEGNHDVSDLW